MCIYDRHCNWRQNECWRASSLSGAAAVNRFVRHWVVRELLRLRVTLHWPHSFFHLFVFVRVSVCQRKRFKMCAGEGTGSDVTCARVAWPSRKTHSHEWCDSFTYFTRSRSHSQKNVWQASQLDVTTLAREYYHQIGNTYQMSAV